MKLKWIILAVWLIVSLGVEAQSNAAQISAAKFMVNGALNGASVGIVVADASNGLILGEIHPNLLLAPASTAKLITSAAAFDRLGPEYRFETPFLLEGSFDIPSGIVTGNLVIRGAADPTLGSAWFNQNRFNDTFFPHLATILTEAGLKSVHGDIVIDLSDFEHWAIPDKWVWEDVGNYYGSAAYGLNIFDNTLRLYFDTPATPDTPVRLVSQIPSTDNLLWVNEIRSSNVNRDLAYVYGSPWDSRRVLRGTLPLNRKGFEVKAALPDPPEVFGKMLVRAMSAKGIEITGSIVTTKIRHEGALLYRFVSPPLSEICSLLHYESVNLVGEALVLELGRVATGYGNRDGGLQAVTSFMQTNVTPQPFFLDDGSGLSRFSTVSARQLNDLLRFMHLGPNSRVYKSTLPPAGAGTLKVFSSTRFPGNSLRAKSGSMTRVRSYAGYLTANSGRELTFAVIANNFPGTHQEIIKAIEDMLWEIKVAY